MVPVPVVPVAMTPMAMVPMAVVPVAMVPTAVVPIAMVPMAMMPAHLLHIRGDRGCCSCRRFIHRQGCCRSRPDGPETCDYCCCQKTLRSAHWLSFPDSPHGNLR